MIVNNSIFNSQLYTYTEALVGKTKDYGNPNTFVKITVTVAPLEYLSNFWRSLEMLLINCKVHIELNWMGGCILSSAGNSAKFKITDARLHIPIVTLSIKYNVNLTKQLSSGFKKSAHSSSYQAIPAEVIEQRKNIYELLNAYLKVLKDYLLLLMLLLQLFRL